MSSITTLSERNRRNADSATDAAIGLSGVARLAAHLLHAPAALVTIGTERGIWRQENDRGRSVLTEDFRYAAGRQSPHLRAEVPIVAPDGGRLGVIRVFDSQAREELATVEKAALADLAALVAAQYKGRQRVAALRERRQTGRILAQIAGSVARRVNRVRHSLRRKVVEDRLRLLGKALDAAMDSVVITRAVPLSPPGPRILYVNQGFTRMTGYSLDDVRGRTPRLLQGQYTDPAAVRRLGTSLRQGHPSRTELLNYRKDGTPFWVELDITPVVDERGQNTHWIAIQRDITVRKDAEKERQRLDAYFRVLFENNPLAIFVYDAETAQIVDVNQTALDTYGCSRAEFLARPLATLVQEEKGQSLAERLATPGDEFAAWNWTYQRSDGTARRARIATHDVTFDGHRRWLIALWDMTEVEQAQLALQAAAAALQARTAELTEVNRRAKLGMWRFPLDGGAVSCSEEIFGMFGRSPVVLAAVDMLNWVHPEDRPAVEAAFQVATAAQSKQTFEFRAVWPDGRTRYCLADLYPELAPGGRCVALKGFCQDITERKETELALLHSEKLRAIGQLASGVAHDFNNLLMVSVLSLEDAIDSLSPEDPLQELLKPVLHATMRGQELTSKLLSYAHSAQLELTHIDFGAFFDRLLPLLRRGLGARYTIDIRQGMNIRPPFGDVAKLESAVMNLVLNARDAMPGGGTIVIETAQVSLGADDAKFAEPVTPGPYTMIRVSDTGHGIPPDVLPRIFDPFFTTKPAGKGSGLGLSVMHGFIKQSGGYVTAESRVGAGTVISIYLPASR